MPTTTKIDVSKLVLGQKIKYGFYELSFMKVDHRNHVLLKDSDGEIRNILIDIFEKHAEIID